MALTSICTTTSTIIKKSPEAQCASLHNAELARIGERTIYSYSASPPGFTPSRADTNASTSSQSSRSVSEASTSTKSSCSSVSDIESLDNEISDEAGEHSPEQDLIIPAYTAIIKVRACGTDAISCLYELNNLKIFTNLSIEWYSLDGGERVCVTIRIDGRHTGPHTSTAFGFQLKAAKHKAATTLTDRLCWFLAPTDGPIDASCLAHPCLVQQTAPPSCEYAMSPKQIKVLRTANDHLNTLQNSVKMDDTASFIAVDIEAIDNPNSSYFGHVKEIGVCWKEGGCLITRHMVVADRANIDNIYCHNATHHFAHGASEFLTLEAITQELYEIFNNAAEGSSSIYLVGWSFTNDQKWLSESQHFNVRLNQYQLQIVDVSLAWMALHGSLQARKLGEVLLDEQLESGIMHNAGNDARGTMKLFMKLRG